MEYNNFRLEYTIFPKAERFIKLSGKIVGVAGTIEKLPED
jgi:hypothetical protein